MTIRVSANRCHNAMAQNVSRSCWRGAEKLARTTRVSQKAIFWSMYAHTHQGLRTGLKNPQKRTSISFLKRVLTRPRTTGEQDLNATLFIRLVSIYRDIRINPQDGQRRAKELSLIRRPSQLWLYERCDCRPENLKNQGQLICPYLTLSPSSSKDH